MNKSVKWKFGLSIAVLVVSVYLILPTLWNLNNPDKDGQLPSWLPKAAMRLGLDLQGGIHMVMGVDLDGVVNSELLNYGRSVERELGKQGVQGIKLSPVKDRFELEIAAANPGDLAKLDAYLSTNYKSVLEIVGSADSMLVVRMDRLRDAEARTRALDQSIETIRNRIDEFGVAEPIISRRGDSQILVQFPGAQEPDRLKGLIGQTAKLSFSIIPDCTDEACFAKQEADLVTKIADAEKAGSYTRETFKRLSEYRDRLNTDLKDKLPANTHVAFERLQDPNVVGSTQLKPFLLSSKNELSGEYIENAIVTMDGGSGRGGQIQLGGERPVVSFTMSPAGSPMLADLTREFRGHKMAIVLDGIVKSAPVIQSAITGGSGQITLGSGGFDNQLQEARDLSIVLRAGALPATIETLEERVIGPSMGRDAIDAGKMALGAAAIMVFAFMLLYYAGIGLISNLATITNICIIFAILGMMGATLTLPGIAGIVLTIGMAVDAQIIIFERMREEIRAGRSTQQVIEVGFDRAFSSILDSNVTTAIGAFVLLEFGTGSIRGFALTLLVGIMANVFTATVMTKAFIKFFIPHNNSKISIGLGKEEMAHGTV
jgi:preprotein translocase subunit SecD